VLDPTVGILAANGASDEKRKVSNIGI
jgi:hypothetical protein